MYRSDAGFQYSPVCLVASRGNQSVSVCLVLVAVRTSSVSQASLQRVWWCKNLYSALSVLLEGPRGAYSV